MTVLLAVAGSAPGIGKSTLCTALTDWLSGRGLRVDHFREEEILTRGEFAAAAEEFRAGGEIRLPTLLSAVTGFVASVRAAGSDVVVADSLVPFVPSLMAWGHSEEVMAGFLRDLAAVLRSVTPIVLYVDGDPAVSLVRAAGREEPGWLGWFLDKLARSRTGPAVHDLDSAVVHLRRQRELTLSLVTAAGLRWDVLVVDHADERTPDEVLRTAQDLLAPLLARRAAGC